MMKKERRYASCSFCGGEVVEELVQVEFWWGEELNVFRNIPAGVCQKCGEQYFSGQIYDEMATLAESREKVVQEIVVPVHEI